jgi:hypothetical protein
MLNKIKEFQRQANELKRDPNSLSEFKLWLDAQTKTAASDTVKAIFTLEIRDDDTGYPVDVDYSEYEEMMEKLEQILMRARYKGEGLNAVITSHADSGWQG